MTSLPIACTLPDGERARRQRELQETLRPAIQARIELEDGYALRFPGEAVWVRRLGELIAYERECCAFLSLELVAEPGRGPVWLRMRGPEGTKAFLARAFAACDEEASLDA
jgi:hypothetical protein